MGTAGLGNRMRFTLSSELVARAENRSFSYFWPTGSSFQPELTDLWEYTATQLDEYPQGEMLSGESNLSELRHLDEWKIRSYGVTKLSDIVLPQWEDELPKLKPVEIIEQEISEYRSQLPKKYVGISIRANSLAHENTIKHSPIEWYEERMREFYEKDSSLGFFVSSDVPELVDRLGKKFPNVIGMNDKGVYNSTRGVQAAVVDLYLLASSVHILAPFWSSFPYMAFALSNRSIPLQNSINTIQPVVK